MIEKQKTRKPYAHPNPITDAEREKVIKSYQELPDNRIKAIAELHSLNYSRVDRIVDEYLKTPKT